LIDPAPLVPARAWVLPTALALAPLAWLTWRFAWVNDDAYITFSYARSLASGHGFVHHPAGPAIEGFSELLFTLWSALGLRLGSAPEPWAWATTLAASAALVVLVVRTLAARARSSAALIGPALALGGAAPLAVWATSGMGVAPFVLAVCATCVAAASLGPTPDRRHVVRLVLSASAVVLLRVDGAWWVAWLVGFELAATWLAGQRARARALAAAAAVSAAVFGVVTLWRVLTFGDWLPNTARAKLGFGARATERGLDYVVHFVLSFPGAFVLVALALFAFAGNRRRDAERRDPLTRLVLVGVAATVLHAVLAGGDFMAFGRFLLPALPLLAIGGGIGLMELGGTGLGPRRTEVAPKGTQGLSVAQGLRVTLGLVAGLGMLLPALDVPLTPTAWRAAFRFRHNPGPTGVPQPFVSEPEQWRNMCLRAEEWGVVGRDLARWSPPDASFVAGAVGALGWFSERRVFDRHGLLAREVALLPPTPERRSPGHDKFVGADFFAPWRPTYDDVGLWPAQDLARHPYADRAVVLGPSERAGSVLWVVPGPGFTDLHPVE
jgi:hypothetical protein